jgi:cytochrome c biogenesis protein CcmG, thiol:disulfide interchange protein DsbE
VKVLPPRLLAFARYAVIAAAGFAILNGLMRHASGPKEGARAAAFDLPLVGPSGRVSLAALQGKPVLLEVFASWCGACRRTTPRLAEVWRDHRDQGITFLGVSVDSDAEAARSAKVAWPIPFDVAVDDGTLSRDYGIRMLPTLVYIDAGGIVRHVTTGSTSKAEIEGWLAER